MSRKLHSFTQVNPNSLVLLSYDGGESWGSLGVGSWGVGAEVIDGARQAAELDPSHSVLMFGSVRRSIEFKPPLKKDVAERFAIYVAQGIGATSVAFLEVPRTGSGQDPSYIPVPRLPID